MIGENYMNNTTVEKFYQQLLKLINNSHIQVSTAYFILKSITQQVELIYKENLFKEQLEGISIEENQIEINKKENDNIKSIEQKIFSSKD